MTASAQDRAARSSSPPGAGLLPRGLLGALPIALPTLALAYFSISGIYAKLGHAGATLDDSYIHFQYARSFAELHPFRYQAGEPHTMGATSLLWPLLLAPFHALGFREQAILWPAWTMSFVALGLLAYEAMELTRPLAGRAAAVGAGAMVLAFSAFAWCAASGMEVVPFAFLLARCARRASEWVERGHPPVEVRRRRIELLVLALLAPLMRPEGSIASVFVAGALLVRPEARGMRRAFGALALAGPLLPFAISGALTGSLRSNAALVKLLIGNPYYRGSALFDAVVGNLRILVGTLLNGEVWSAEFLPKGGAPLALAGLAAVVLCGLQSRRRYRALSVLAIALSMAVPCAYSTFLWNRLRYLWPFATGWLVGLACLARVLGDALAQLRLRFRLATPLACGAFAGALVVHQSWSLEDVASSASGIDRQHVRLARWAKEHLPETARLGVNDTGAIAYLSDRHTFDIVGLSSAHEARYWVAGPASRFEHYERLHASAPAELPTHFIVYPEWMGGCDVLLGPQLFEATVRDATILGGTTMGVYEASYSLLGSGEQPWTAAREVLDALDVADLESEEAHAYDLAGARDGEQVVKGGTSPDGRAVADGGRSGRTVERFRVRLPAGSSARGIVRLEATTSTRVTVRLGGAEASSFDVTDDDWSEYAFAVPATPGAVEVELRPERGLLTVYHYWFDAPK